MKTRTGITKSKSGHYTVYCFRQYVAEGSSANVPYTTWPKLELGHAKRILAEVKAALSQPNARELVEKIG